MSESAPERPPQRGGFSLTKRYGPLPAWAWGLIGGVGLYAGYRFYKARQGASTAATTAATTDQTGIDYAPQIATLQTEIQNLQGAEATEPKDTDTDTDVTTGGRPPGPSSMVRVPDVVGQRAAFAISTIEAAGLETVTVPPRNPKREYTVTGQTPKAGAMVPRRSVVNLRVKQTSGAARTTTPRRPAAQKNPLPGSRKAP